MIINRNHNLLALFLAFKDLNEFFETPCGTSVVLGENDHRDLGLFDGLFQSLGDLISSIELVIHESFDLLVTQSFMKMAYETVAGVIASEAEENIILGRSSHGL